MSYQTTDLTVTQAIRDILLSLGLTPNTLLTSDVNPGDLSVTVNDPSVFLPGQLFTFYEDVAQLPEDQIEDMLPIPQDWDGTNPIPIDWVHAPSTAFTQHHAATTPVGTNLFMDVPIGVENMLTGTLPLIFVVGVDEKDVVTAGHQIEPIYSMHIEYRRSLVEPRASGQTASMEPNLWAMLQQRRCRREFDLIALSIRDNPHLVTDQENALGLGDPQQPGKEWFQKTWNKIIIDKSNQHFAAMGDFSVRGFRQIFYGDVAIH